MPAIRKLLPCLLASIIALAGLAIAIAPAASPPAATAPAGHVIVALAPAPPRPHVAPQDTPWGGG
jgi:hypothetical protein